MATKMIFKVGSNGKAFIEEIIEYSYFSGFAVSQKQKSINSLHTAIKTKHPGLNVLEISTKSPLIEGVDLSAFNLTLDGRPLECVFQSSKVFEGGIKHEFLLNEDPREAKRYNKEFGSKLEKFNYKGEDFPLNPPSLFYDYIYIQALIHGDKDFSYVINYDAFTDIEFNEKKQINCQARACAIYAYLLRNSKVEYYTSSIEKFKELYGCASGTQLSLFETM